MYRTLQSGKIVETATTLAARVGERFPGSGLSKVASEVATLAREAHERGVEIRRPHRALRAAIAALLATGLAGLALLATQVRTSEGMWQLDRFLEQLSFPVSRRAEPRR